MNEVTCPCCGYKTLDEIGVYEICLICYWEDDPIQRNEPNYEEGANRVSLKQGQKNYLNFGACEYDMRRYTREPYKHENQDPNWIPLD